MAKILDTKRVFSSLLKRLAYRRAELSQIGLASIRVKDDSGTDMYIEAQKRMAKRLKIDYRLYEVGSSFTRFRQLLRQLNEDKTVQGVIIHKPLPSSWDEFEAFSSLTPAKDIEGLTPHNLGRLLLGRPIFLPPTVASILYCLKLSRKKLWGANLVIVGFSSHIGKPLSFILADKFSTVSITHIATYKRGELPFYLRNAEIIISCVGKPFLIKGVWIKKGAVVIDVGISRQGKKILGDVEYKEALKRASFLTPVPGGVGKLTTLFLFENLIKAKEISERGTAQE